MDKFTESVVEEASLVWLGSLGNAVLHGPDIAAGEPAVDRSDPNYRDVVLEGLFPKHISGEARVSVITRDLKGIQ